MYERAAYSPVAQAQDAERQQESQHHLQPLNLSHIGEAEVHFSGVLHLSYSERQQGEQRRGHPDEAAAETRMWQAVADGFRQRDEAVEAHPGQEENAAVHVDLLEKVHEGAEAGVVVVFLLQVEDLDQRVRNQIEVGYSEVYKVEIGACQVASEVQIGR